MSLVRATRLTESDQPRRPLFAKQFPPGTVRRRLVFLVLVPLLIILFLILLFDKIIMPAVTRQGDEFMLPDLVGQKISDVQISLDDLELGYEIAAQEYAPGEEEGIILSQYPRAGTQVKSGRIIKLTLSLGQKLILVPDVSGRSVRQAMLDLEAVGLVVGEVAWAFSDTIPERVVVFSYPASGTEVPLGASVNLMVNRGRASTFTFVPRVVGLPLSEARRRLEEKNLRVGNVSTLINENYLPETVLEQSEPEGGEVDINTAIDLVVSAT